MPTRRDLPPLPAVEKWLVDRDVFTYTEEQMMEFGAQSWNAAISAALECSGDSVINGFISELYLQADNTASSSAE